MIVKTLVIELLFGESKGKDYSIARIMQLKNLI